MSQVGEERDDLVQLLRDFTERTASDTVCLSHQTILELSERCAEPSFAA